MERIAEKIKKIIRFRLILGIFILWLPVSIFAAEISVCKSNCDHATLASAIEASRANDVIIVKPGTYAESGMMITHSVTIRGIKDSEGRYPVIDGTKSNHTLIRAFKVNELTIESLEFRNTGVSYTEEIAGVRLIESTKVTIRDCFFNDTTYGVYLEKSTDCKVLQNQFTGTAKDESSGGNGVHIWTGSNHVIESNLIEGHRDGIYLEFATKNVIQKNRVMRNIRYGLHFMSSHETSYFDNVFSFNGVGVAVMYSHKIVMHRNEFSRNVGPTSYGLLLKDIKESEIFENRFYDNTVGIFMEGSNRSVFKDNLFISNGWGLRIMGDCENNELTKNDFINNTFEVTTNADHNWNQFHHNYWSLYSGYDLNRDGIGDVVHRPVSLSSVILERVDSAYILMRSPLFYLLDQIEKSFPTLIPEPLKDDQPLIKPIERKS